MWSRPMAEKHGKPRLCRELKSGTTQLLIAVSPVNSRVVWAAGTGGTYVVTTDGGETWKAAVVPGAENLHDTTPHCGQPGELPRGLGSGNRRHVCGHDRWRRNMESRGCAGS